MQYYDGEWSKVFELMLFSGSVGIIVGLLRAYIETKDMHKQTVKVTRIMATSFLAAEIVSLSIYDFGIGLHSKVAITSICAYIAPDILLGIQRTGKMLANNPLEFLASVLELLRGGRRAHFPDREVFREDNKGPSTPNQRVEP